MTPARLGALVLSRGAFLCICTMHVVQIPKAHMFFVGVREPAGARRTSMHLADLEQRSAAALAQSEQVQQRYTHTWPASSRFSHARQPTRHI